MFLVGPTFESAIVVSHKVGVSHVVDEHHVPQHCHFFWLKCPSSLEVDCKNLFG